MRNLIKGLFFSLFTKKVSDGKVYLLNNQKMLLGNIKLGKNSRLGFGNFETAEWLGYRKSYLSNQGKIFIGSNTTITNGYRIHCKGELNIGNDTYINPNCEIRVFHKLNIGDNCAISWGFKTIDDDSHTINDNNNSYGDIAIGNNVWIGMNVTILKNVVVGDNAVIAAGSLVTKNVPKNSLVGGVPARIINDNVNWK
jgi:acetyltransferase-like isoleucine patch superfamily enzyme